MKQLVFLTQFIGMSWSVLGLLASSTIAIEPPILRVSLESAPVTLDWNASESSADRFILSFLMRGLMKYQSDEFHSPVCDLCETLSFSSDRKTVTFQLKKKILWSDGKPLLPTHFKDSFQRLQKKKLPLAPLFKNVSGVSAKNKSNTLTLHLSRPTSDLLHLLTLPAVFPIRKELLKKGDFGIQMAQRATLGPYFLGAWEQGKRLVIEGNPHFSSKRPVYRVEFILGSSAELREQFEKKKIEILTQPTTEDLLRFKKRSAKVSPYLATRFIIFNLRKSPTSQLGIRKAISLALDLDQLPHLLRNGDRPVAGIFPTEIKGGDRKASSPPQKNLSLAKSERHRALPWEKWIELELLTPEGPAHQKLAQWFKTRLTPLRIRVLPQFTSKAEFYQRLKTGNFQVALHTHAFRTASPGTFLKNLSSRHPFNWPGLSNSSFDQLIHQLDQAASRKDKQSVLDKISSFLSTLQIPFIPLSHPSHTFLLSPRVEEFHVTPFADPDLLRIRLKN